MTTKNNNDSDLFSVIRKNLPIVVVFCTLVAGAVRTEMTAANQEARIIELEETLNKRAFTDHAIWKTNISRDVQELQKLLSRENIRDWDTWREKVDWQFKVLQETLKRSGL